MAEYLAGKTKNIVVVEMLDEVGKDLGELRKICVMENLYKESIKTLTNAKCIEIKEKSIAIEKYGNIEEVPCDSVVVSIGSKSWDSKDIVRYCEESKIPYYVIGDALKARRALNCIAEAVDVARKI